MLVASKAFFSLSLILYWGTGVCKFNRHFKIKMFLKFKVFSLKIQNMMHLLTVKNSKKDVRNHEKC